MVSLGVDTFNAGFLPGTAVVNAASMMNINEEVKNKLDLFIFIFLKPGRKGIFTKTLVCQIIVIV